MRLICHWFSGTGNTLWAVRRWRDHLAARGLTVELRAWSAPPPAAPPDDAALGVAFPVYAQGPPPFVVRWLRSWPPVTRPVPVIVISTMAGASGMVKWPVAQILRAKGYAPWAVCEIRMPPNYIYQLGDERREEAIRRTADRELAQFATALADDAARWPWRPPTPGGLAGAQAMFRPLAGWLGRGFQVDPERCTRCGLCVRLCPVDNLRLNPPATPARDRHCEQCLRCLNFCPTKAIVPRRLPFLFRPAYRCAGINAGDLLPQDGSP